MKKENLKIFIKSRTPSSLILRGDIVESVIIRIIVRIQKSLNFNDTITIEASYVEKNLVIQVSFELKKEKKIMNIFQSNKDFISDKNQLFSQFNTKLLEESGGLLRTQQVENKYTITLKMPALIIKI